MDTTTTAENPPTSTWSAHDEAEYQMRRGTHLGDPGWTRWQELAMRRPSPEAIPARPITKHCTVAFCSDSGQRLWLRVTAVIGKTVNLGGLSSGKVLYKRVPLDRVIEDGEAQWDAFTRSETYRSM